MFLLLTRMRGMFGTRSARRRVAAGFVLLTAVATAALPAAADPRDRLRRIEAKTERVEELQAELADKRGNILGQIQVLDEKRQRVEAKVNMFDDRLAVLDAEIADVKVRLTDAQQKLALVTDELEEVLRDLEERTELFEERAVAAYVAGPTAYMESILSTESFSDLLALAEYHQAALDSDAELVGQIEMLRDDTESRRTLIEDKQAEIISAKQLLESHRTEITLIRQKHAVVLAEREAYLDVKEGILSKVERDQEELRRLEAQLDADSDRLRSIISAQASTSSGVAPTGTGQLLWPAAGPLTSAYGWRTHPIFGDQRLHTGVDIAAGYGSAVVAADDGVVTYAGAMSGYGNVIVVDHGGGLATTYNHLSAFSVGSGQAVGRGAPIGGVGCSGYCTGPHLHFEVRVNGSPVDPMPYL